MAGMIQEQTKQQINGMPGLMQLPVLGALFKSRDYINRQTELMVLVTPYMVRAVAQKDLSRPDDGFADASDAATHPARPLQPASTASPARPTPKPQPTAASTASFSIERATRRRSMTSNDLTIAGRAPRAVAARSADRAGSPALLAGCNTTTHGHHRQHSERLSPAPSDRAEGRRADRSSCSSAPAAAA